MPRSTTQRLEAWPRDEWAWPEVAGRALPGGNDAVLLLLQVPGGQGRGGGAQERPQHLRDSALGGPVPEHQAERHQRHRPREVPTHAVGAELLRAGLGGALRAAPRGRGGRAAAAGRRSQGGADPEAVRGGPRPPAKKKKKKTPP